MGRSTTSDSPNPLSLGTVQDAARILKCGPDRVRQLEREGMLSALRTPGGVRLFDLGQVERLAAARRVAR